MLQLTKTGRTYAKKALALVLGGLFLPLFSMESDYQLLDAAESGDTERVRLLVLRKIDTNIQDRFGKTPLHRASYNGHVAVTQLLLDSGVDKEKKDWQGSTPLYQAVRKGHKGLAAILLSHEASVSTRNKGGNTVLHKAVSKGFIELVALLRRHKAQAADKNNHGNTSLHKAARKNHTALIENLMLIDQADATEQNKRGRTAVHYGASRNQIEVCEVVMQSFIMQLIQKRSQEALPRLLITQCFLKKSSIVPDMIRYILASDDELLLDIFCCSLMSRTAGDRFKCISKTLKRPCKLMHKLSLDTERVICLLARLSKAALVALCSIEDQKGLMACEVTSQTAIAELINPIYIPRNLTTMLRDWLVGR